MAVFIIEKMSTLRRGPEIPAALFERRFPGAGLEIDHIDILVLAAIEVAHKLVLRVIDPDRPALLGGGFNIAEGIIGKSEKFFLQGTVDTKITEVLVPFLLDLLLGLEPFVKPMPENEVGRILVRDLRF